VRNRWHGVRKAPNLYVEIRDLQAIV